MDLGRYEGYCWGDVPLIPLRDAEIRRVPTDEPCVHKTYAYRLVKTPPFEEIPEIRTYQACWRNELVSLQQRHLVDVPEVDDEVLAWATLLLVGRLKLDQCTKWTPEQVLAKKKSAMQRKRYENAFASLARIGFKVTAMNIEMFEKVEKWKKEQLGVKPPRSIQHRSYPYCAALSQFLCPIEELIWKVRNSSGSLVFSKAMDSWGAAANLRKNWDYFVDPVAVLADARAFDSSVQVGHIKLEKHVYEACFAGMPELGELMDGQLKNNCYSKGGIRYDCIARKMSGEYNTSLGDSLINFMMLLGMFNGVDAQYVINGDDSVVILER